MHGMDAIRKEIAKGTIRIGMTLTDLKLVLGEPTDWGGLTRKNKYPSVFKYGVVEFGFTRAKFKDDPQYLCYVMHEDHTVYLKE